MASTAVVRLYLPGRGKRSAHWSPAAIIDGLTLCGLPTRGLAGRAPQERETARRLPVCADCQHAAERARRRWRAGHRAAVSVISSGRRVG